MDRNRAEKCGASRGAVKRGFVRADDECTDPISYEFLFTVHAFVYGRSPPRCIHNPLRLELYTRYAICMAMMAVVSVQHQCR